MGPVRFPDGSERRSIREIAASGRRLEGHAAIFNSETRIGNFRETIRPGAFRSSLASGKDILALTDHDPSRLLARTGSGTLRLSEDAYGLRFDLDVPDTQLGRDLLVLAQRGDLGGMSFAFRSTEEVWAEADKRELRSVDLFEVSVVLAFPSYANTTVNARSEIEAGRTARGEELWYAEQVAKHKADLRRAPDHQIARLLTKVI